MARLLTYRRASAYSLVPVSLYVAAWVYEVALGSPPLNEAGVPIGGDYIAFHTAGRVLLSGRGALLYDHGTVEAVQAALLGGGIPGFYDAFRNPPFFALPFVPLAPLDLLPGFAVWTVISLGCLGVALRLLLDEVPDLRARWRGVALMVAAFAPLYFGVIDGQNATVSLLLFVLIYRALVRGDDAWAGVWAALGLFKPQLFVLFPLVLLVTRRWRGLAAWLVTSAALVAVSLALVGVEGAAGWLRVIVEPESHNAAVNAWRMASLKALVDLLLVEYPLFAMGAYLALGALVVAGVVRIWTRRCVRLDIAFAFTALAAVLVDPHLVDYDLTVLICAGVLLVRRGALAWLCVALYLSVVLRPQLPIGDAVLIVTPLLLCLHTYLTWRLARPVERRINQLSAALR